MESPSSLEKRVKFYIFLVLQTPSFLCTIFLLYHFNWRRLHGQIYGVLIVFNALIIVVELPFTLYFLYQGTIHMENRCTPWITLNYSLFLLDIMLMSWTSIERYLFIYHERLITQHCILLHYVPTICIVLYCPLFFIGTVILHKCQPAYDVNLYLCGGACYQFEQVLGLFDWVGNGMSMVMVTFIVNVVLIVRHLVQRHRMRHMVIAAGSRSRRSAKLSMQLLGIALPYMIAWIPYSTVVAVQIFYSTEERAQLLSTVFVYLPYAQALSLPYLCILFIPEVKRKLILFCRAPCRRRIIRQQNRIHAMDIRPNTKTGY